ncbi:MAG: hypothetical protein P9F19_06505 [Candidatus Contendobacter sp.]|nr:hypothetical protein [Candidatus Contendobacter sp.]MDG4557021.1 hypothetical protein [Candidatus Contendobacter sp.]
MKSTDDIADAAPQDRAAQARRTAIALAILAAVFYVGIILTMAWR